MKIKDEITIACVESYTGGLFASTIVSEPGASKYFKGGLITYSNDIKEKFNIDISNGVINKEVAAQMALKGKDFFNVDYCISFTGNAGPESIENKEVGLVYIAINNVVFELKFGNRERNYIRNESVKFAINELEKIIAKKN